MGRRIKRRKKRKVRKYRKEKQQKNYFDLKSNQSIVFVWSQNDGGNIEQRTIGYGCRQYQEAKLKNCGRSNCLIQPTRS